MKKGLRHEAIEQADYSMVFSDALMKKGLRRRPHVRTIDLGCFFGRPDEEGIKTLLTQRIPALPRFFGRPDEEGIKTIAAR